MIWPSLPWRLVIRLRPALLAALLVVGCATAPAPSPVAVPLSIPSVVGTDHQGQPLRAPPGAVNPDVTQANIGQTICVSGWTATVRPSTSYTNGLKAKLLRDQGLPASDAARYELDHLIPLALGGHPRKPENLWLQPWDGEWGARVKDRLEERLKTMVCRGELGLQPAQQAIATDWVSAYKKHVNVRGFRIDMSEPID